MEVDSKVDGLYTRGKTTDGGLVDMKTKVCLFGDIVELYIIKGTLLHQCH